MPPMLGKVSRAPRQTNRLRTGISLRRRSASCYCDPHNQAFVRCETPLNLPLPSVFLVEQNKSENIRAWVEREAPGFLAVGQWLQVDYVYQALIRLRTPLQLPHLPRSGIKFQKIEYVQRSKQPKRCICSLCRFWNRVVRRQGGRTRQEYRKQA